MITYKINIIRHAITQGNLDGRFVGTTDMPICDQGRYEIEQLTKKYKYPEVEKVYTSSMLRCKQTADIIYPDNEKREISDLRECCFGVFENKTAQQLESDPRFIEWTKNLMSFTPEGGEDMAEFAQRIERGFEFVILDMMKNKIKESVIITHGGVIMALLGKFGIPKRDPAMWLVENGRGYTLVTSAQLWSRDKIVEVYNNLPFGEKEPTGVKGYEFFNVTDIAE